MRARLSASSHRHTHWQQQQSHEGSRWVDYCRDSRLLLLLLLVGNRVCMSGGWSARVQCLLSSISMMIKRQSCRLPVCNSNEAELVLSWRLLDF